MRIDACNRVSQLYQANSTKKSVNSKKSGKSDRVDVQVARAAVAKAPDVRENLVADIKQKMAAGTYQMDMDALADKLLTGYPF